MYNRHVFGCSTRFSHPAQKQVLKKDVTARVQISTGYANQVLCLVCIVVAQPVGYRRVCIPASWTGKLSKVSSGFEKK